MQRHKQKIKGGKTKPFRNTTPAARVAESGLRRAAFFLALPGDTLDGA